MGPYVILQGFEPRLSGPKPLVLPLHHRTIINLKLDVELILVLHEL